MHTVAEELEEGIQPRGTLLAHSQRTRPLAPIQRALDIVLEDATGAVVGEALAELHGSHHPGRVGQRLCNVTERGLLRLGGLVPVGGVGIVVATGVVPRLYEVTATEDIVAVREAGLVVFDIAMGQRPVRKQTISIASDMCVARVVFSSLSLSMWMRG